MAQTSAKLLIFVEQDSKKTAAFMFLTSNDKNRQALHYKNLHEFTGHSMFYTLEGSFANGWSYVNGKITEVVSNAVMNNELKTLGISLEKSVVLPKKDKVMLADAGSCSVSAYPIYSTQCITIEPIPEQGGSSHIVCTTVLAGMAYIVTCVPGSGDIPGSGGYIPPNNPPNIPPTDPPAENPDCAKAKSLNDNANYNSETSNLKTKVDDNTLKKEVGYIKRVGSQSTYTEPSGTGLEFPLPNMSEFSDNSLEYFNHTHYDDPNALSTFSFEDFFTYAKFLGSTKIVNVNTFTIGVTTKYGTYAFVLGNRIKFNNYLQTTINDFWLSNALSQAFRNQTTGVSELNTGSVNEKNLLNIIKDSGIKLLKKNATTGAFKPLELDANGNAQEVNCPGTAIE